MSDLSLHPKHIPTFYFIGVTTSKSSIMKVFPLWMAALGRSEIVIEGVDFALHDAPERYQQMVAFIKADPLSLGGLVTTHKIDLLAAAQDLFEVIDPYAQITHEISCISKQGAALHGHAKDPITAGLSLRAFLKTDHFAQTGGDVLCLGAGGAGSAIALHFINADDRPQRFIVTDKSTTRLDELRAMVTAQKTDIAFTFQQVADPAETDRLLAQMPAHSLIINATGMGKDLPGSPLSAQAQFPQEGIIWELNYRGELDFMQQALAQQAAQQLQVEDGWVYFLHGWTQVISEVLHRPIEGAVFNQLAKIAENTRGT